MRIGRLDNYLTYITSRWLFQINGKENIVIRFIFYVSVSERVLFHNCIYHTWKSAYGRLPTIIRYSACFTVSLAYFEIELDNGKSIKPPLPLSNSQYQTIHRYIPPIIRFSPSFLCFIRLLGSFTYFQF